MFANWQWNARDCVTGLHSWLRRSCDPVTQYRAFHCHFAHTRAFSILSQTYCVQTQLRWPLYNEFYTKKFIHTRFTESIFWFSCGHFYFVGSWLVWHTAWEIFLNSYSKIYVHRHRGSHINRDITDKLTSFSYQMREANSRLLSPWHHHQ